MMEPQEQQPPDDDGRPTYERRRYSVFEHAYMALADLLFYAVGAVLWLGGQPLQRLLCVLIGHAGYFAMPRRRHVSLINLDLAYGDRLTEREKRRIVRRMFVHFVRLGLDFIFDYVYWPPRSLPHRFRMIDYGIIHQALTHGKGVLCVSGHLGNWEMMAASMVVAGLEGATLFKRVKNPWADRFVGRKRDRYGIGLIETPRNEYAIVDGVRTRLPRRSVRRLIQRHWKQGNVLGYLCDQYPADRGLRLPFLGVPDTPTPVGALRYAVEMEIPLTLLINYYNEHGDLSSAVEGPILMQDRGGTDATVAHYAEQINDWLSDRIREHPEQWTWGHRRFDRHHYDKKRHRKQTKAPGSRTAYSHSPQNSARSPE